MILQVVMANPAVGKNPSNKKVLNNSNPDLASIMAHSGHIQLTNRNILSDEKENSLEKNFRQQNLNVRSPLGPIKDRAVLRPALRTLAIQKQAQQVHHQQQQIEKEMLLTTPKITKTIRFNLGSGHQQHNDSSDLMTPTPPPKEFKRMNSERKTLRNTRCMSTVITEKERALLFHPEEAEPEEDAYDSPKAPTGFVKSMCRLYSENFGLRRAASCGPQKGTDLNRSSSFSGTTKTQQQAIQEASEPGNEEGSESPFSDRRGGSFRLFRSRSWSLRRKKSLDTSPTTGADNNTGPRLSPSYSVKSQDSGFSDSGEGQAMKNTAAALQRTQFFSATEFEDESDPNLTQVPDFCVPNPVVSSSNQISILTAKQKIEQSLGNIASVNEGLRLKRSFLDEEGQEMVSKSVSLRQNLQGRDNLLRAGQTEVDKLNEKKQLDSLSDMSCSELDGAALPTFSTPVRASFRRRMVRPRTTVVAFHLEDAKTPSKREAKTKLKEVKARRRWSNIELAELQLQQQQEQEQHDTFDASGIEHGHNMFDRSDVPSCIEPSLVAVWSQFLSYEPSVQHLTLSSAVAANNNSNSSCSQQQLSDTRLSYMAPSLCVDGTSTQLLVQSFNQRPSSELEGHRSLLHFQTLSENGLSFMTPRRDDEETIIEMEAKSCSTSFSSDFNASPRPMQQYPSVVNTSPVNEWWKDLHAWCEPECMTYLQSKPILSPPQPSMSSASSTCGGGSQMTSSPGSVASTSSMVSVETSTHIVDAIRKIQRSSKSIQVTFTSLNNHFNSHNLVQMSKTVQVLLTQIQEHIFEYNLGCGKSDVPSSSDPIHPDPCEWNFPGLRKNIAPVFSSSGDREDQEKGIGELLMLQQRTVLQLVDRLKMCTHRCQYTPQQPLAEMRRILASLHKAFKVLVDKMITKEIKPLVREIAQPTSDVGIRSALHTVIHLGNEGPNSVCALLAREGGVRALLKNCRLPNNIRQNLQTQDLRVLSLRGLSAICCMADCIRELESCDGLSVIDELLSSRYSSLEDRIEAAGLLAQITSPWITDNHKIENLDCHVASMVSSLTGLSRLNGGEETFLLVTAALANLTFMSPLAAAAMRQCRTAQALVNVVRASFSTTTLFSKDQVVTVLANLAANANIRHDIQTLDGVGFLLAMLETKIHSQLSQAEVSAAERVQKKSAIALSRLCNDSTVCRDLLRLGGIDRLVELCKNASERNYSDAVLVACLAVLRRVKHNLETKMRDDDNDFDDVNRRTSATTRTSEDFRNLSLILEQLDATDLVQPKLVDSFVEYSSGKHSYV